MTQSLVDTPCLDKPPFYLGFSSLLKQHFDFRVYKVTIDAGMTCPNIDGKVATGGCTYCDNTSFSPAFREGEGLITRQIDSGVKFYRERYKARQARRIKNGRGSPDEKQEFKRSQSVNAGSDQNSRFLAYFQTFSNTYAPIEKLKRVYDRAMKHSDVVGMSIGTRPDCIDEEKLKLIQSYVDGDPTKQASAIGSCHASKNFISIEYGMQTMHDQTAIAINRGHDHQSTIDAMELTRKVAPDVHICLHIIIGLPGETHDMIRASAEECARLKPDSVKIHHCYVYDNTRLAEDWRNDKYRALEFDEYVGLAADVLERMPPTTYIQRLTGEISGKGVLAPHWGRSKLQVKDAISDELGRRGTYQGAASWTLQPRAT